MPVQLVTTSVKGPSADIQHSNVIYEDHQKQNFFALIQKLRRTYFTGFSFKTRIMTVSPWTPNSFSCFLWYMANSQRHFSKTSICHLK